MKERDIELLDRALDALAKATDIKINIERYFHKQPEFDAIGVLLNDGDQIPLAIKLTGMPTNTMLAMITQQFRQFHQRTLLIANYVNPIIVERLKAQDIWFLDTAGNAYINQRPLFIYIKGNKPVEKPATRTLSRAFQPTGLKVIYAFLCNPELVNAPYREIAQTAGVALGTVGWVITDLTQLGHIVDMGNRGRRLKGRRKLLERWVITYPEKLRPKLEIGRYKATVPDWWQTTPLTQFQAYWGGEVAADKLTNYLKPEIITLYIQEKQAIKLILTNKLRKEPAGNIELLKTFWDVDNGVNNNQLVNPILIYADLMATGDPRNIETAEIIYEQELAQHFRED
jgi:hypothetical protein